MCRVFLPCVPLIALCCIKVTKNPLPFPTLFFIIVQGWLTFGCRSSSAFPVGLYPALCAMCGHIRLHRKGLCFVSDPGTGYVSLIWGPLPQGVQRHLAVCISCHRLEGYAGLFCVVLREVAWCLPCVPLCVQKGGTSLRDGSLLQDCFGMRDWVRIVCVSSS